MSKVDLRNLIRNAALTLSASGSTSSRCFARLALYLRLQWWLYQSATSTSSGGWSQSLLNDFKRYCTSFNCDIQDTS